MFDSFTNMLKNLWLSYKNIYLNIEINNGTLKKKKKIHFWYFIDISNFNFYTKQVLNCFQLNSFVPKYKMCHILWQFIIWNKRVKQYFVKENQNQDIPSYKILLVLITYTFLKIFTCFFYMIPKFLFYNNILSLFINIFLYYLFN